MRIGFIGGTAFVGRGMVESAIERGHEVSVFHRGRTGPALFPDAEHVIGDRATDLDRLAGHHFDALVDVCAYHPAEVHTVADALASITERYVYVSSVAAYRPDGDGSLDEDSPLLDEGDLPDPTTTTIDGTTYGPFEALCERAARDRFPDRTLVLRPCYVVGPHDYTDRLTWWVRQCANRAPVVAVEPADGPIQLIDVRDLGEFTIRLVENGAVGAFNAVGPETALDWAGLIRACAASVTADEPLIRWLTADQVRARGGTPERDFPMWTPPEEASVGRCSPDAGLRAGLTLRPLDATIADLDAWDEERGRPPLRAGLDEAGLDAIVASTS